MFLGGKALLIMPLSSVTIIFQPSRSSQPKASSRTAVDWFPKDNHQMRLLMSVMPTNTPQNVIDLRTGWVSNEHRTDVLVGERRGFKSVIEGKTVRVGSKSTHPIIHISTRIQSMIFHQVLHILGKRLTLHTSLLVTVCRARVTSDQHQAPVKYLRMVKRQQQEYRMAP